MEQMDRRTFLASIVKRGRKAKLDNQDFTKLI